MTTYNLKNIRILLTESFSDQELRRLCYDNRAFRPVYNQLAENTGKVGIIDRLLEYAEQKTLLNTLLELVKQLNPTRFILHQPYYEPANEDDHRESLSEGKPAMSQSIAGLTPPTIGIITALPKEYVAVDALLEHSSDYTVPGSGAGRRYRLGMIPAAQGGHHAVVLSLADMGNNIAASRATLLLEHFPSIKSIIMVGIAGGVPHPLNYDDHVRLGDVVVSDQGGIIQYDFDKEESNIIVHRHPPRPPSAALLEGVRLLQVTELKGEKPWLKFIERACNAFFITRPPAASDVLVRSTPPKRKVPHPHDPKRSEGQPRIFTGPIASANKLLKNPVKRDYLRDKFKVKAVEMEGSGIADATWNYERGYLVVRGICDYCDSNKGDNWQNYAAVVAAAYTRALLESMPAQIDNSYLSPIHQAPPSDKPIRNRRIDATAPSYSEVGQSIDILVQVRFIDSPFLGLKDWPTKYKPSSIEQTSETVTLKFPQDSVTGNFSSSHLKIRVVISDRDFKIEGSDQQSIEVLPYQESKIIFFRLTPLRKGNCRINVQIYNVIDGGYLGTIPVETIVDSQAISTPSNTVTNLFITVVIGQENSKVTPDPDSKIVLLKNDLNKLINNYQRRLQKLKEQQALQGYAAEPSILLEIEDIEAEIKRLQAELDSTLIAISLTNEPPITPPEQGGLKEVKDRPFWRSEFPKPQPIWLPNNPINVALNGFDPFPSHLAENELNFLFGEIGGFWSEHPRYFGIVSANMLPEVILAEAGSGKTAFAHALIQIGDAFGLPLADTLPLFVAGDKASLPHFQTQCASALLDFVRLNSSLFLKLDLIAKKFLLRFWLQNLPAETAELRLRPVFEADKNLVGLIEQVGRVSRARPKEWPGQVRQGLELLGFKQALLAIDFNQQNLRGAKAYLEKMPEWASASLIVKVFLPLNLPANLSGFLARAQTSELSWNREAIRQLTQWRFERVAVLAGVGVKPENLFDDDLYHQFIDYSGNNPRRLARLWRQLVEDFQNHPADRFSFSGDNLTRAAQKVP